MDKTQAIQLFPIVFRNWLKAQTMRPSNSTLSKEEEKEFHRFMRDIHKSLYRDKLLPLVIQELLNIKKMRPRKAQTLFHNLFPHDKIIRSLYRKKTDSPYFDVLYALLQSFCRDDASCRSGHNRIMK